MHDSDKYKYNMAWVELWVWPVEKWLEITPKTCIIFLSSDVIWNIILVLIQSLMTGIAANVLENLITVWSVKQAVGTPLYFMTLNPLF